MKPETARICLALAALFLFKPSAAEACGCCTNTAQRHVTVEKLESGRSEEISHLRFAKEARVYLSDGEGEEPKGMRSKADRMNLAAAQQNGRILFSFDDGKGGKGTLTLALPDKISIFEVDPREKGDEGGLGPLLYKEWKLTAKFAGNGIFQVPLSEKQSITLILQGRGQSCTTADDFSHWTLVIDGPAAAYQLFGDLEKTP